MKTVLVVGAGASRAEADARPLKIQHRPPLDTDFFALSERHSLETHREMVQRFTLRHFALDCFTAPRPRMEEVFSLVYTSTLGVPVPEGAAAAFSSLCRIYATVVASTTNQIQPSRKGPLCRILNAALHGGETTVITFNQDILIEKALRVLTKAKATVAWHPNTGYELDFDGYTSPRGSEGTGELFDLSSGADPSNPLVLKPHGSLNWYVTTLRKDAVPSRLRKNQKIKCTRRLHLSNEMTFSHGGSGKGRKTWYTWPIIVPPVLEKGAFLGTALAKVWQRAWEATRQAERVIVYGYSFPDADAQTRGFFLRAGAAMSKRPLLITINPDRSAAVRAAEIFRPDAHLTCSSVRACLRHGGSFALGV